MDEKFSRWKQMMEPVEQRFDSRPHRGYVTTGIGGSGAEKLEMEVSIERDGDVITSQIGDSSTLPLWP